MKKGLLTVLSACAIGLTSLPVPAGAASTTAVTDVPEIRIENGEIYDYISGCRLFNEIETVNDHRSIRRK